MPLTPALLGRGESMGRVIERHGHTIDENGLIHYDDQQATFEQAEAIVGRKLDHRRNYAIIDGNVCECATWTAPCSGCAPDSEPGSSEEDGCGCSECGYTGRVRRSQWVPIPGSRYYN